MQSLLKTQRVLERDIAALRGELDTLRQAHKIESSNSDEELRALVRKWKAASRAAAEVVYVDVRDRVNRWDSFFHFHQGIILFDFVEGFGDALGFTWHSYRAISLSVARQQVRIAIARG